MCERWCVWVGVIGWVVGVSLCVVLFVCGGFRVYGVVLVW